ncbi:MAG: MBL fold metallo-hydrolase [Candidatus Binatus sp.]
MNWPPLPVDAHEVDAVLLTHAHLDHSGFMPALVRDGIGGKVISKRFASASRRSWDGTPSYRAISSRCV